MAHRTRAWNPRIHDDTPRGVRRKGRFVLAVCEDDSEAAELQDLVAGVLCPERGLPSVAEDTGAAACPPPAEPAGVPA